MRKIISGLTALAMLLSYSCALGDDSAAVNPQPAAGAEITVPSDSAKAGAEGTAANSVTAETLPEKAQAGAEGQTLSAGNPAQVPVKGNKEETPENAEASENAGAPENAGASENAEASDAEKQTPSESGAKPGKDGAEPGKDVTEPAGTDQGTSGAGNGASGQPAAGSGDASGPSSAASGQVTDVSQPVKPQADLPSDSSEALAGDGDGSQQASSNEEQPRFAAEVTIRVVPEKPAYGEDAELVLEGLESANMNFSIKWERTDLRDTLSRDEDRLWQEMDCREQTLKLEVTQENAAWAYRAVLTADNNDEVISESVRLEPAEEEKEDETAVEAGSKEKEDETAVEAASEEKNEAGRSDGKDESVEDGETTEDSETAAGAGQTDSGKHVRTVTRVRRTVTHYVLAEKTDMAEADGQADNLQAGENVGAAQADEQADDLQAGENVDASQGKEETDSAQNENETEESNETPEFVLPENRSVDVTLTWDVEEPVLGDVAHFAAKLNGYDGLETAVQWQISPDGENWTDVEGANKLTYDVEMVPQNYRHQWRAVVTVLIPEETEEAESVETSETEETEAPSEETAADAAAPTPLKTVTTDEVLEVVTEAYDGDEDIEETEVVEETVVVVEVADESEIPETADPEMKTDSTEA